VDLKSIIFVGLGSFFGGSLRYVLATVMDRNSSGVFPWSILLINSLGSFLIGVAAVVFSQAVLGRDSVWPLFVSVGMLGGFTTFSTFSLQTLRLAQDGHLAMAFFNALGNVSLCLLLVYLGLKLANCFVD
tara:strand:- start:294 stop:683 length:390 start_codon:yes stop_codon:yes gene_type:complete